MPYGAVTGISTGGSGSGDRPSAPPVPGAGLTPSRDRMTATYAVEISNLPGIAICVRIVVKGADSGHPFQAVNSTTIERYMQNITIRPEFH